MPTKSSTAVGAFGAQTTAIVKVTLRQFRSIVRLGRQGQISRACTSNTEYSR